MRVMVRSTAGEFERWVSEVKLRVAALESGSR